MQDKISIVGTKARDKALVGANYLAEATKSTIGPFGCNALIEKGNRITNDGVTIARELCGAIENEVERRGAITLFESASKTNDEAGDGTSTSVLLAQTITKEAIKFLPSEKQFAGKMTSATLIKKIEAEKEEVIRKLTEKAKQIETKEELINSAKVSVENDELATLIGEAQFELGKDGVLIAEETAEPKCSVEYVKGVRIDNGFGTSVIINNQEKQCLEDDNCEVIMTNYTLSDLFPLKSIIDQLVKSGKRKIVIIARAFNSDAIRACLENHKTGLYLYPLNAPYVNQAEIMGDLASVLGGKYYDYEVSSLEDMTLADVGFASKVLAKRYDAIITGRDTVSSKERIEERVFQLREKLKGEKSEFAKKAYEARIAQLENGFAIIKVGATSDQQRKYLKDKCDDAVNAVRSAFQEGVVDGAGLAYKQISDQLPEGYILKKPLLCLYNQIMENAPEGFKIEPWVKDPLKVLRVALERACSVASTFATINIVICNENMPKCKCNGQGTTEKTE